MLRQHLQVYDLFASDYSAQQESPTAALQRIIQNKMWSHIDGMYGTRYCQPFLWLFQVHLMINNYNLLCLRVPKMFMVISGTNT